MEVRLTTMQETQLNELAAATGRRADDLVQEAVDRLLAYEQAFRERVQIGLDQAKRSEFIDNEEVRSRIDRMFRH